MAKIKKPHGHQPQWLHNKYGIRNWMKQKLKVTDSETMDNVIKQYCEKKEFVSTGGKNDMKAMEAFISNRFGDFASFAANIITKMTTAAVSTTTGVTQESVAT